MYNYIWDKETGGYLLDTKTTGVVKAVRPVFKEELILFGFDKQFMWEIPETDGPIMWAEGRRYIYFGECVGEVVGGGLYENPKIKALIRDLKIRPVNILRMIEKNKALMTGLEQKTLKFIYDTFKLYSNKVDIVYVAFSGGKDSIVMLDLVQRALPHDGFSVVFADTTMELSDTYTAVDLAQNKWADLDWHKANSHFVSPESWDIFGPPAERLRWCCSVHKTVPQVLLIKDIIGKSKFKTLVYVGVRAEESESRSTYEALSDSKKHIMQTSCCPILEWGTCELFLYIFQNNLFLNNAYKKGLTRVGCVFCPMSSKWSFLINGMIEPAKTEIYANTIKNLLTIDLDTKPIFEKYFNERNWKLRLNGRDLSIGSNRLIEVVNDNYTEIMLINPNNSYMEWLSTIGQIYWIDDSHFEIEYKGLLVAFQIVKEPNNIKIRFENLPKKAATIRFLYLLRNALNKSVYCKGCKACTLECPVGAINMEEDGEITIKGCLHCENCLNQSKGCIIAQSLALPLGGSRMNNLAAYQTRGFRQDWLELYFELETDFWANDRMGKNMFLAFKAWMRDADLLNGNSPSDVCKILNELGSDNFITWGVIYNNLAYNSSIINWFVNKLEINQTYNNDELNILLGDEYTSSVKNSALKSLKETMKASPIGWGIGISECEMKGNAVLAITRRVWQEPEPLAILYCLYKYAEKSDSLYSFTLSDICNSDTERLGISPTKLYGIDKGTCKQILELLARDYSKFIKVNFNKNIMEDIYLESSKTSLDVLKLLLEGRK